MEHAFLVPLPHTMDGAPACLASLITKQVDQCKEIKHRQHERLEHRNDNAVKAKLSETKTQETRTKSGLCVIFTLEDSSDATAEKVLEAPDVFQDILCFLLQQLLKNSLLPLLVA